eukprot:COSAG01_NODE_3110_length_6571_cov_218.696539_13_plen_82_part_00
MIACGGPGGLMTCIIPCSLLKGWEWDAPVLRLGDVGLGSSPVSITFDVESYPYGGDFTSPCVPNHHPRAPKIMGLIIIRAD